MTGAKSRPARVRQSTERDYDVGVEVLVAGGDAVAPPGAAVLVVGSGISIVAAFCPSPVPLTPPIATVSPGFRSAVLAVTSLMICVLGATATVCVVPSAYFTVT